MPSAIAEPITATRAVAGRPLLQSGPPDPGRRGGDRAGDLPGDGRDGDAPAARGRQDAGRPAQGGAGLHREPAPVGAAARGAGAGRGRRLLDGGPGRRGQPRASAGGSAISARSPSPTWPASTSGRRSPATCTPLISRREGAAGAAGRPRRARRVRPEERARLLRVDPARGGRRAGEARRRACCATCARTRRGRSRRVATLDPVADRPAEEATRPRLGSTWTARRRCRAAGPR